MRGRQSGIRYGQKKQEGQSDTAQLIEIKSYLRKKYKFKVMREPYLLFRSYILVGIFNHIEKSQLGEDIIIKNPDLLWTDKYGTWIVEIDGAVHDRMVKKTNKRNELFIKNHIKLIVVNLADLKELDINIYDYIDEKIKELI